jgi:putative glutamine amidotransferase
MEVVLYTQRVEVVKDYNERRDCADQRIPEFIRECGYLPVPMPNDCKLAGEYIKTLKPVGIMLTGGNSLVKYGGNAPERDDMERTLITYAVEDGIPVYGFCRGMQYILDYFGVGLVNVQGHVAARHEVDYEGSRLEVNSYHNQACMDKKAAEDAGFDVLAVSDDGVIEAIRHKSQPIVGTMWHPERENPFRDFDIENVRNLFENRNNRQV